MLELWILVSGAYDSILGPACRVPATRVTLCTAVCVLVQRN